jgi:hypothetical protein
MVIPEFSRRLALDLKRKLFGVGLWGETLAVKSLDELKSLFVEVGICPPNPAGAGMGSADYPFNSVDEAITGSLDKKLTYASFSGAFMEITELGADEYQISRGTKDRYF